MRKVRYIICMILVAHAVSLAGQTKSSLRELFVSAEGDILFEDYAEALPKYMSLLQIYPENFNLYYRIGQCYLNTPGEKEKAIPWLETAAGHINPNYRKGKLRETGAPYDALYFLANAYRIANDFDRALETYDLFLKDVDTEKYDTALVRFQMQTCHNAREMMRKPVFITDRNLGSTINERFSEFNPVISDDEKTLLFTRELQFYDAIFWSRKIDGQWTEPVNLTPQLGIDQDYYTSSLSPDGRTLLMYRTDTYDGNIYLSRLEGNTWSKVEKLNSNVNTRYWESHATMSRDGKKLFFTSNRKESIGGLDIFVSVRDSSGNWGPAQNLGPRINTIYNEDTPFLANNDSTLFFSSRGHYNMGGYDIFRSDMGPDGQWSVPVNVGYPLNTSDDDMFFHPLKSGDGGYYARFADDGFGRMDIFSCSFYKEPAQPVTAGKIIETDLIAETAEPGTVPQLPADLHAYLRLLSDTLVNVSSADPVSIGLIAEANSLLEIEVVKPDSEIRTEQHTLTDSTFTFVFSPERGSSLVTLRLRDSFGNDTATFVRVLRTDKQFPEGKALSDEIGKRPDEADMATDGALAAGGKRKTGITTGTPVEKAPSSQHTQSGTEAGDSSDKALNASGTEAADAADLSGDTSDRSADDTYSPEKAGKGKCCSWWWLLALAALLLFFLLWRRRKKKNDKEQ